jgi:cytochrome c oxidase assembly protein subunit 16
MAPFESRPLNPSRLNKAVQKNPALFGVPFLLLMVAASYGMSTFTQTRYDLHDHKIKQMTKEQELGLNKERKKFDIREEYFKLSAQADEEWEQKRIQRPPGVPEWGVPGESSSTSQK